MSSIVTSLKLINAKRHSGIDPLISRRQKLSQRVKEQIAMASALMQGDTYVSKRLRIVKDAVTGLKQAVEVNARVKEWWFFNAGKVCVQLRYANRVLPLTAKGDKNAVEVETAQEMIEVLTKLDAAINAGELDSQITATSESIRKRFKK